MRGKEYRRKQPEQIQKTRRNCIACGKFFYIASNKKTKKYCSRYCQTKKEQRRCIYCEIDFVVPKTSRQVICMKTCPALYVEYDCIICTRTVVRPRCFGNGKFCTDRCRSKWLAENVYGNVDVIKPGLHIPVDKYTGNRKSKIINGDFIDKNDVFDFYEWKCIICDEYIDKELKWPDKMSVTLEHIVPLGEDGTHTWDNVAPAHLLCNENKKDLMIKDLIAKHKQLWYHKSGIEL